jgi:CRISPR-associated protein Cas1
VGFAESLGTLEKKAASIKGATMEGARNELLGVEGVSGRIYWEGVQTIIEGKHEFFGRVHRGATDKVNSMLNYGYGILYSQVWGAVVSWTAPASPRWFWTWWKNSGSPWWTGR